MVTTPGVIAAFAAPGVMLGVGQLDRRVILWALSAIFVISNATVALAPSLPILLAGRMLLGIDVGAFLGQQQRDCSEDRASGICRAGEYYYSAGISAGTVAGVPAGTLIGDAFGWRASFGAVASFGALVMAAQLAFLRPRLLLRL